MTDYKWNCQLQLKCEWLIAIKTQKKDTKERHWHMQGNVRLPLSNTPHGIGTEQLEYLSPEDAMGQMKVEEVNGKLRIWKHGNEKVRIVVSESSEGKQHLENFMGCTVSMQHEQAF